MIQNLTQSILSAATFSIFLVATGDLDLWRVAQAGGLVAILLMFRDLFSILSSPGRSLSDNSPQARYARDEISMLELEQEIERELNPKLTDKLAEVEERYEAVVSQAVQYGLASDYLHCKNRVT